VHLDDVAELAYKSRKSSVYHIPSKTFNVEKNGYIFEAGDVGLGGYYYDDNLEILNLDRLHWNYIMTNQGPKEDGNKEPALFSMVLLLLVKCNLVLR
jgi:hypothetical protein